MYRQTTMVTLYMLFQHMGDIVFYLSPLFLREPGGASVAVAARRPVEALALQQAGVVLQRRADVGVPVALAPAAHADLLDGVVVPPRHRLGPRRHGHEMPQHGLGLRGEDQELYRVTIKD